MRWSTFRKHVKDEQKFIKWCGNLESQGRIEPKVYSSVEDICDLDQWLAFWRKEDMNNRLEEI